MIKSSFTGVVATLLPLILAGCNRAAEPKPAHADSNSANLAVQVPMPELSVRTITLPEDEPELRPGPGRQVFYNNCITCHSSRYITNQPPFPREIWTDEVNKMIRNYSAQIQSEEAGQIVDYLMSINGSTEKGP